jgi:hypothetical protein
MKRTVVIVASGLAVAGCASMGDLFGPSTAELSLASEPPGAEARTSTGQSCRTPCRLTLPLNTGDFTVTFTLPGRIAQVVPVTIRPPDAGTSRFDPNPVFAQLDPATPPPAIRKKGVPKRKAPPKKRIGGAPPPPPPPPPNEPAPPPPGGGSPPGSPWPPPPR